MRLEGTRLADGSAQLTLYYTGPDPAGRVPEPSDEVREGYRVVRLELTESVGETPQTLDFTLPVERLKGCKGVEVELWEGGGGKKKKRVKSIRLIL